MMATGDADIDAVMAGGAPPTVTGDSDIDAVLHKPTGDDESKSKKDPSWWDKYVGFQEGQLAGATGGVGSLAGGLSYLGDRLLGKSDEEAQADKAKVSSDLTYSPRTAEGKKNAAAMSDAASYLGEKEGKWAGEHATDAATALGASPSVAGAAGATAETLANVPQYVAGELIGRARGSGDVPPSSPQPAIPPPRPRAALPEPITDVPASSVVSTQTPGLTRTVPKLGAPELTATDIPRAKPTDIPGDQPKIDAFEADQPYTEKGQSLPASEQQKRVDTLRRVGLDEVRKSALTGDAQAAADEYQTSLMNSPGGKHLDTVISGERSALENHADNIVSDTGGTPGSPKDQSVTMKRGENFLAPLDALNDHFDDGIKQLYGEADKRAQGQPVALSGLKDLLGKDSEMTNTDRVQLRKGLTSYLNEHDMIGEDGSISGNAQQAETIRKYLNENWSPANSKYTGKLKNAIDDDVTKAAGDDIYKQARALRALKARTLEDPKGIAQLVDSDGPGGINRTVPVEKVMDKLTTMPVAQLKHITDTLQSPDLPESIKPAAQQAIAELNAHMASQVADQGKSTANLWNAKGVTNQLRGNSERLKLTMPEDQLDKLKDLNDAGNYLKKRQGYPGAYIQEHNLVTKGLGPAIRFGSEAAGHLGGMGLGLVSRIAGDKVAGKVEGNASLRAARERTVKLSEYDPTKQ